MNSAELCTLTLAGPKDKLPLLVRRIERGGLGGTGDVAALPLFPALVVIEVLMLRG